jgi:Fic family protein
VATIESIGSSTRIEGVRLTDREIEQLLSNLDIKAFASRDEQEVAGYAEAMETVFTSWEDILLTENHIKQLHRDLLQYTAKDERHRGAYKTLSNIVEAFGADGESLGVVFQTAAPFDTPRLMGELIAWTTANLEQKTLHPLIAITIFVVVLLEIQRLQGCILTDFGPVCSRSSLHCGEWDAMPPDVPVPVPLHDPARVGCRH